MWSMHRNLNSTQARLTGCHQTSGLISIAITMGSSLLRRPVLKLVASLGNVRASLTRNLSSQNGIRVSGRDSMSSGIE